ncbi:extracellular solute-binding protein [Ruania halotolerans]|uniref:extracellular solute-binding protein n=1 Tax=Ruania halotolerans TaxID=2897773 RepID=UPI001E49C804|nr:extracellular solute-binding protein [Ruania halotolerans]UFU05903.1 extracellular solute-binding protein [Ruania halotolerans]
MSTIPRTPLRRRGVLIAAGAATALTLAACGGGTDTGDDDSAGDGGTTTVSVWHGFTEADGDVVNQLAEEFNASQDAYEVQVEVNPWNVITDKLLPAVSAGNGPDLVVQPADAGEGYVNQGVFVPMDDFYADPENDTDTYYPHVVDYAAFDGTHYGVPMAYGPFSVWYNTEMFAEAGITEDDIPTTWEEWVALAEELTVDENGDGEPEIYGLALPDADGTFLPTFVEAGGGAVYTDGEVTLDTDQNVETLQWWQDAYEGNWGPTNVTLPEAVDLFKAGKAAMTVIGPWIITGAESVGLEIDVFEMPAGPEGVVTQAAANYWWLTSQADEDATAGAQAFLRHYNNRDSQVLWAQQSYYPPNRTDITAEELADTPFVGTMIAHTENSYIRMYGIPGGLTDVNAELSTLNTTVTQGGDLAATTTETAESITEILSRFE